MASPNLYVRSTDGSDADNGTTWALAKLTIAGAASIDSTTDNRIWVSDAHAESSATAQTLAFAGTLALPTWVVCGDDAAEPPTATATTATFTTTGVSPITITGSCFVYGITFNCGTGSTAADLVMDNAGAVAQTYELCTFKLLTSSASSDILIGANVNAAAAKIVWNNCNVLFSNAAQDIALLLGDFLWNGGSVLSGSTAITGGLIKCAGTGEYIKARVSGVDLQHLGSASSLVEIDANSTVDVVFRNCRLPGSWTGGLYTGTLQARDRVEMYNCDSADTNYRIWIADYAGTLTENASIYRDAGALFDTGAQRYSWQIVTTANAEFPHMTFRSTELGTWNNVVTGTLTATVEIVHNSQGSGTNGVLLDSEIWLEVMYYGTTGLPLGTWTSDKCANLNLNSNAAAQATSSEAWTGDAVGWDTQKLTVSFDPKEPGYVVGVVHVAKASATVYVDPKITLS